jgi:Zn-dependent protease
MFDISRSILQIAIFAVPFLLGVVCHEVAHGLAALYYGDTTAKLAGRLTLNPLKHLDPMGTAVFVITALMGGVIFGWAKPVPIDPRRFTNVRQGLIVVSAAGAAANFLVAGLFLGAYALLPHLPWLLENPEILRPLVNIFAAGVLVNAILGVFNLLPVPPLDGSKIVTALLPMHLAMRYMRLERYGMLLLILLLFTGVLRFVFMPVFSIVYSLLNMV